MSRYNLGGDSAAIHCKVIVNKMTKQECQTISVSIAKWREVESIK